MGSDPLSDVSFGPYCDADFEAVTQVWFDSAATMGFPMPVSLNDLRDRWPREIADGWAISVAKAGGIPVGFMALKGNKLDQLFVAPDYQGRGIGKRFVDIAKLVFPDGVFVTAALPGRATKFYEREGFRRGQVGLDLFGQEFVRFDWRPQL
jgi:GNAT superfamily N-acetyltransferase